MIRLLLGAEPGAAGELVWTTAPQWVLLAVLLALAALGVAWRTSSRHRAHARLRLAELLCWGLALAALVVATAGPAWVEEAGRTEPGKLVVLVDGSASMAVVEEGRPRSEAVAGILARLEAASPGQVEVFTFDEELSSGAPATYEGRGTDLGVALEAIADRHLGQDLRGVVVITDGLDRGALRADWREAPGALQVPELPGPLSVYQVGDARELQDLAVEDVESGGFAFLRTPFEITARIRGQAGEAVPVTLTREGSLVGTKRVVLDAEGRGEASFEIRPERVGRFAWEVSVPVAEGDAVPGNNAFPVVIRVVRDRTRVLQVCGSPSYDQKFLRLFLKEDPSVDLVSFFILRTREDMGAGWRSDELSLIAFPYERLFTEDLGTFDLVIFQNFDYDEYFDWGAEQYLRNIASYVREGGAFVMLGGDRSFDLGLYAGTPIAEILPVDLGVQGELVDVAPFQPLPTVAGQAHPITRLSADAEENARIWERLPRMDGVNRVSGLSDNAASLLAHPSLRDRSGEPLPVLSVREVGAGRSMALAVDSSWRWSFTEAGEGRGNQAYLRFWKNAMRWLVADPEDQRVVVSPSRENVLLGDEVRLVVKVRDTGYGAIEGATVSGEIIDPDGVRERFELVTDTAGEARTAFTTSQRGAHRVKVESMAGGMARAETVFAVSARDPELVEIVPDGAFLEGLVAAYGTAATLRAPGAWAPPLVDEGAGRVVQDRREQSLATAPVLALFFGLFASLAWWFRRRGGAR